MSRGSRPNAGRDNQDSAQMDAGETIDANVLDPEEYTQKRRLRDIFDTRANVAKVEQNALTQKTDPQLPGFGEREAREAILAAVQGYLTQVEPLMIENYAEQGEKYWNDVELGKVTVDPPDSLMIGSSKSTIHNGFEEVVEPATPTEIEFQGVGMLLQADSELAIEFSAVKKSNAHAEPHTVTEVNRATIPRQIPMKAFRQTNLFLAEIGLDLDPDEGRPFHDFGEGHEYGV